MGLLERTIPRSPAPVFALRDETAFVIYA